MKSSQVAVAGGVFGAVLIGCFALIGFGTKGEVAATPEVIGPESPPEPTPAVAWPVPKPGSAAAGGFGEIARTERLYDPAAVLAGSSPSAESVLATWTLPDADGRDFRLRGERLVAVSSAGIRVMNARTGETVTAVTAKIDPDTALSPHGDWAVQAAATGLTRIDTATGKATPVPATGKRSFSGPVAFGPENGWCAVLGEEAGMPTFFRVRRNGEVDRVGPFNPNPAGGKSPRIGRLYVSAEGGRVVVERPDEKSPAPRFLSWKAGGSGLRPLPAFNSDAHDAVPRLALSPDGKRAALYAADTLKVFDLEVNRLLLTHKPDGLNVGGVAFAAGGNRLVVADVSRAGEESGFAWVLDLTAKAPVGRQLRFADLGIRGRGVRDVVLSADDTRLLLIERDGRVRLVDTGRAFGPGTLAAPPAVGTPAGAPPAPPDSIPTDTSDS
jgi:hypothetical protein